MTITTLRRSSRNTGILFFALVAALVLANTALAQEAGPSSGLGIKGIGVRLGLNDPEGASSALMYGVHLDAGEFVNNVHVIPSVEYWSVGVSGSDFSDLAFKLGVNFDFPLQDQRMVPYLGGGLGLHRLKVDVPGPGGGSDTKFGLDVQGGARNQFTPNLSLFGELGYTFISDSNQLRLQGGLTYHFIY